MKNSILSLVVLTIFSLTANAQKYKWKDGEAPTGKWYWKSSPEGFNFSLGQMVIKDSTTTQNCFCSPRFSMFFNYGQWGHYNFSKNAGVVIGAEIKNIGFSYLNDSIRFKARNYYIGIPVLLKFGNLKKKSFMMIGGGADLALHYKEKYWTVGDRSTKVKSSEWFSSKTNLFNPYVTVGYMNRGYGLSAHYYLNSFYKNDISIINKSTYLPQTLNTNILYFSLLIEPTKGLKLKGGK